jgi:hypothetical protein
MRSAFACDPAEHGVDQARVAGGMAVRLHQTDREIDGGMVGHVEEEDLRRADQERGLDTRRFLRQAALEQQADEMAQRAEPPHHPRHPRAPHSPIARGQGCERGVRFAAVQLLVERAVAAEHAVDDVGGDAPDGEAGRGVGASAGT